MTPLRKLFDFGTETAASIFNKQSYLEPMWIGVNKKGSHIPLLVSDMSDKNKAAETVRCFLKKQGIIRYVSMLESWVWEGKEGEIPPEILEGKSLEHNPDRREAIIITAEDNEGNEISGRFYILRPEHGKPKLSPLKLDPREMESVGRFAGMFN